MRSDVLNSSSNSYGQQIDKWKFSAKTAAFTAADGFCYLVTDADGCAVTLPAPNVGDRIKIVFGAVTSNNHPNSLTYEPSDDIQPVSRHFLTLILSSLKIFGTLTGINLIFFNFNFLFINFIKFNFIF